MSHDYTGLAGPDFLKAIANAEEVNGNLINAAEFRRRARDWQRDINAKAMEQTPIAVTRPALRRRADAPRFRT